VEDFHAHVGVMALRLEEEVRIGDIIHIRGHKTNLTQTIDSIQIEYLPVKTAKPGESVGIKTEIRVHPGDMVYKLVR